MRTQTKVAASGFVGLSAHAIDMAAGELWAVGAFGMGGYEKIVEFNCGVEGYVCFGISGYNGNFGGDAKEALVSRKRNVQATRADGTPWVYPQDIVPARVYVGKKGYKVRFPPIVRPSAHCLLVWSTDGSWFRAGGWHCLWH
jgi:hypothetical protein